LLSTLYGSVVETVLVAEVANVVSKDEARKTTVRMTPPIAVPLRESICDDDNISFPQIGGPVSGGFIVTITSERCASIYS